MSTSHTHSPTTLMVMRGRLVDSRREYVRKKRKLQLRQHCWFSLKKADLTQDELKAFEEMRETGEEAFWADTHHHEKDGIEYIEVHVDFLGDGVDARHDELRRQLGKVGGRESVRFSAAAAAPCEYEHASNVCKCKYRVVHSGQDEACFKVYALQGRTWVVQGVSRLRKKTEGPGEMVSAFSR